VNDKAPLILFIDDEPEEVRAFATAIAEAGGARTDVVPPGDIDDALLGDTSVILMDLSLDKWDGPTLAKLKKPAVRGLGLIAQLQEYVQQEFPKRAIAFAVNSGKVPLIAKDLAGGDHVLARIHNVEWVFRKEKTYEAGQLVELARAVRQLPEEWSVDGATTRDTVTKWLALNVEADWSERAWLDLEDCHPPFHGFSVHTRGIAFLRWMLQRILPYPTALIDLWQLAARLRVTPASLESALEKSEKLRSWLAPAAYTGQLAGFLGRHWWRAGINALSFELSGGRQGDLAVVQRKIVELGAGALETVAAAQPVVVLDAKLNPLPTLCPIEAAVRVQPDDWPSFASPAWMAIDAVRADPALLSFVLEDDRDRVPSAAEAK
jgi:CheY-like chemotaxis protein